MGHMRAIKRPSTLTYDPYSMYVCVRLFSLYVVVVRSGTTNTPVAVATVLHLVSGGASLGRTTQVWAQYPAHSDCRGLLVPSRV